jgi:hypothetical protein
MTNREFSLKDKEFIDACSKVGLPNHESVIKTKGKTAKRMTANVGLTRQASKWRMRKGLAWKEGR